MAVGKVWWRCGGSGSYRLGRALTCCFGKVIPWPRLRSLFTMAMNASTSWTGIPRDFREQERLRLEHQLFRNISFENDGDELNLDYDPAAGRSSPIQHGFGRDHAVGMGYDDDDDEGDSFSVEFPRNPQMLSHDYTAPDLSIRYPGALTDHEEGETKSTLAHHAHAVTFRTGLRGRGGGRTRAGSPSADYDPDRQLDALVKGASDFSILADSPVSTISLSCGPVFGTGLTWLTGQWPSFRLAVTQRIYEACTWTQ
jgi:hypothetical protein